MSENVLYCWKSSEKLQVLPFAQNNAEIVDISMHLLAQIEHGGYKTT